MTEQEEYWEEPADIEVSNPDVRATLDSEGKIKMALDMGMTVHSPEEIIPDMVPRKKSSVLIEIPEPDDRRWEDMGISEKAEEYYSASRYVKDVLGRSILIATSEYFRALEELDLERDDTRLKKLLEQVLDEEYDIEINFNDS